MTASRQHGRHVAMLTKDSPGQVPKKKQRTDGAIIRIRPSFHLYLKIRAVNSGVPIYRLLEDIVSEALGSQRPWETDK